MSGTGRRWTGLGVALVIGAGLAACGEGADPAGPDARTGAAPAVAAASAGQPNSGEAAAGETGGEAGGEGGAAAAAAPAAAGEGGEGGETGAVAAFATVPEASRAALRIAQLSGFLLVAEKTLETGDGAGASVLIDQGLLEVQRPAPEVFGTGPAAKVAPAYSALSAALASGQGAAQVAPLVATARQATTEALAAAGGAPKDVVAGLLSLTRGLYGGVNGPSGVDPIEYQHAFGAALATQAAFQRARAAFAGADAARTEQLGRQIDQLVAAFPSPIAPEAPPANGVIAAATARAELALSGLR